MQYQMAHRLSSCSMRVCWALIVRSCWRLTSRCFAISACRWRKKYCGDCDRKVAENICTLTIQSQHCRGTEGVAFVLHRLRHFDTSKNDPRSEGKSELKLSSYRSFLSLRRGTFLEQKHAQNRGQEKQKKPPFGWLVMVMMPHIKMIFRYLK